MTDIISVPTKKGESEVEHLPRSPEWNPRPPGPGSATLNRSQSWQPQVGGLGFRGFGFWV